MTKPTLPDERNNITRQEMQIFGLNHDTSDDRKH